MTYSPMLAERWRPQYLTPATATRTRLMFTQSQCCALRNMHVSMIFCTTTGVLSKLHADSAGIGAAIT